MMATQEKTHPETVRLVTIKKETLEKSEGIHDYNPKVNFGNDGELLVFPCAPKYSCRNIYLNSDSILQAAGYTRDKTKETYKDIFIPDKHKKQERGKNELRTYATALTIAPDELKTKFPNAEVITVESLDALKDEYKKSVDHNEKYIEGIKKAAAEKQPPKRHYTRESTSRSSFLGRH
jgi:hypothetical protein